ncbi:MAG: cyclic-di-AMP receptor [Erysipelotrichaceae bacterium]
MKLIFAVVSNEDSHSLQRALTKVNLQVTELSTTGGFLKIGNTTLIIGVEDHQVEQCISIIKEESQQRSELVPSSASYDMGRFTSFPLEVTIGGATVFVVDVEQFIKV